ncbi:DUF4160 domain-containing protein [Chitinimonas arctica]|uniref:DUF4160 domain-containing protein n=1 Tax=Chitinimonas arctica TaxID=2594795 RepID=UPI001CC428B5|nr:DUF4160 domain-containing protein [Chitinimonas arctica]
MHVGTDKWDARFLFSFWHNGVKLWDVTPAQNEPTATSLEDLRLVLKQAGNLRRARELWWSSRQTLCLENLQWDMAAGEVVSPKDCRQGALVIQSSRFDTHGYKTVLYLTGQPSPLEIEL